MTRASEIRSNLGAKLEARNPYPKSNTHARRQQRIQKTIKEPPPNPEFWMLSRPVKRRSCEDLSSTWFKALPILGVVAFLPCFWGGLHFVV